MATSLDSVLSGEPDAPEGSVAPPPEPAAPEPTEPAKAEAAPEPAKTDDRPRGPDGKFLPKEAAPAEPEAPTEPVKPAAPATPTQPTMTPQERAYLKMAEDERHKRQELEARLKAIEDAKQKEPPKTFWDDPEGALKALEVKIDQGNAQVQAVALNTRLNTAEAIGRQRHTDFDEKVKVFGDLIQNVPGLYQRWMQAADPGEFAYQTAKDKMDFDQLGSIDAIKTQAKKEARLEMEAELKAKAEAAERERAAIPSSLSAARGTGNTGTPAWAGPTPLDQILKH